MVSASSEEDLAALRTRCGADEALTKHDVRETLVPAVTRLLRGSRASRREADD